MKISVITVNFNNREGLARTLESSVSLRAPSGGEKEIIIIDGGSTDGSVEEIQKVEKDNRLLVLRARSRHFSRNE